MMKKCSVHGRKYYGGCDECWNIITDGKPIRLEIVDPSKVPIGALKHLSELKKALQPKATA
jgi:hypothetical protein